VRNSSASIGLAFSRLLTSKADDTECLQSEDRVCVVFHVSLSRKREKWDSICFRWSTLDLFHDYLWRSWAIALSKRCFPSNIWNNLISMRKTAGVTPCYLFIYERTSLIKKFLRYCKMRLNAIFFTRRELVHSFDSIARALNSSYSGRKMKDLINKN